MTIVTDILDSPHDEDGDPPPIFSSWGRLYEAVLLFLLLLIFLFYIFGAVFTL